VILSRDFISGLYGKFGLISTLLGNFLEGFNNFGPLAEKPQKEHSHL